MVSPSAYVGCERSELSIGLCPFLFEESKSVFHTVDFELLSFGEQNIDFVDLLAVKVAEFVIVRTNFGTHIDISSPETNVPLDVVVYFTKFFSELRELVVES
jgi:hypothetical protein